MVLSSTQFQFLLPLRYFCSRCGRSGSYPQNGLKVRIPSAMASLIMVLKEVVRLDYRTKSQMAVGS